jgi:hypothetical protein
LSTTCTPVQRSSSSNSSARALRSVSAVRPPVDLEEPGAVAHGLAGVEARARDPGLLARVEERDAGRVARRHVHEVHRAVVAVVRLRILVRLQPLVQRVGAVGVPAGGAVLVRPAVEVLARRPERDARVVARAAAEHLGARVPHGRVAVLLRLDRVVPVVAGLEQLHPPVEAEDHVEVPVVRAGLDEGHLHVGVLAEAGGDRGARGSPADDHVVVLGAGHVVSSAVAHRAANHPVTCGRVFW